MTMSLFSPHRGCLGHLCTELKSDLKLLMGALQSKQALAIDGDQLDAIGSMSA